MNLIRVIREMIWMSLWWRLICRLLLYGEASIEDEAEVYISDGDHLCELSFDEHPGVLIMGSPILNSIQA